MTFIYYFLFVFIYSYRTRDEIQDVRKNRDPIGKFKDLITSHGLVTNEEIKVAHEILFLFSYVIQNCRTNNIWTAFDNTVIWIHVVKNQQINGNLYQISRITW